MPIKRRPSSAKKNGSMLDTRTDHCSRRSRSRFGPQTIKFKLATKYGIIEYLLVFLSRYLCWTVRRNQNMARARRYDLPASTLGGCIIGRTRDCVTILCVFVSFRTAPNLRACERWSAKRHEWKSILHGFRSSAGSSNRRQIEFCSYLSGVEAFSWNLALIVFWSPLDGGLPARQELPFLGES